MTIADQPMERLQAATVDLTNLYRAQTQQTVKVGIPHKGPADALKALGGEMSK
jgi:hypothetical protein